MVPFVDDQCVDRVRLESLHPVAESSPVTLRASDTAAGLASSLCNQRLHRGNDHLLASAMQFAHLYPGSESRTFGMGHCLIDQFLSVGDYKDSSHFNHCRYDA